MAVQKKTTKKKTAKKSTKKKSTAKKKPSKQPLKGAGVDVHKTDTPDRCDWIHNQEAIQEVYVDLLGEHGRIPTATKIAELTGFTRDTVGKHLKTFDFGRVRRRMGLALNIACGRAMQNATLKGASFKDIELLFKIGGELVDKIEHNGQVDFRSYAEKLSSDGGDGDDHSKARRLSQILISENASR